MKKYEFFRQTWNQFFSQKNSNDLNTILMYFLPTVFKTLECRKKCGEIGILDISLDSFQLWLASGMLGRHSILTFHWHRLHQPSWNQRNNDRFSLLCNGNHQYLPGRISRLWIVCHRIFRYSGGTFDVSLHFHGNNVAFKHARSCGFKWFSPWWTSNQLFKKTDYTDVG